VPAPPSLRCERLRDKDRHAPRARPLARDFMAPAVAKLIVMR
jgi:hypothetical protein